jgi:hypothetical protein
VSRDGAMEFTYNDTLLVRKRDAFLRYWSRISFASFLRLVEVTKAGGSAACSHRLAARPPKSKLQQTCHLRVTNSDVKQGNKIALKDQGHMSLESSN